MVATRSASAVPFTDKVLHYVLETILSFEPSSPAYSSLRENGLVSLADFMSLIPSEIDSITYTSTSDDDVAVKVSKSLTIGEKQRMRLFIQYAKELVNADDTPLVEESDWLKLIRSDFNAYRISSSTNIPGGAMLSSSLLRYRTSTPSHSDPVLNFKKGIKRDASAYPILKDERAFGTFHSATIAIARAHDIDEVFDLKYKPGTPEAIALFAEKQKFVYSVLINTLQTDTGRTFVRQHGHDSDAQAVYSKLLKHHRDSPKAKLDISALQKSIVNLTLDEASWKGTTVGFILHWREQMRKLHEILPVKDHYSNGFRKTLLENALRSVDELRQVSTVENNNMAVGHPMLTFLQYIDLVSAFASHRDEARSSTGNRRTTKRVVNYLDYTPDDDEDDREYSVNYTKSIDQNGSNDRSTYVDNDLWKRLTPWLKDVVKEAKAKIRAEGSDQRSTPIRRANVHELSSPELADDDPQDVDIDEEDSHDGDAIDEDALGIIAHLTKQAPMAPHDIRRVLGVKKKTPVKSTTFADGTNPRTLVKKSIVVDGIQYIQKVHNVHYKTSQHQMGDSEDSLVDRGANGGLAGNDVLVIEHSTRTADVTGIDNHKICDVPISTVAGLLTSNKGPVIGIMHGYAYTGKGATIHSSGQLEWYKNVVDDRSRAVGGKQMIVTVDGYTLPLQMKQGLPRLPMTAPTTSDMETYPHVILTSPNLWKPTFLDNEISAEERANLNSDTEPYGPHNFNSTGDYIDMNQHVIDLIDESDALDYEAALHSYAGNIVVDTDEDGNKDIFYASYQHASDHHSFMKRPKQRIAPTAPDYEALRSKLAWIPTEVIKKTFAATTQFAATYIPRYPFRKHLKSRNPAVNVHRRNEPVATDTVFGDEPAICDGSTCAQLYVGRKSLVTDVYGMKTEKQFVATLQDNIRKRGAMDKLISDRAQVEISKKTLDILRAYAIDDWQSEPHHQHQNFAENRWETIQRYSNRTLNLSGVPGSHWLLVLLWVTCIFNHVATPSLGDRVPMEVLTGSTPDISFLLMFTYGEPVYFSESDCKFPANDERPGLFVGISHNVGDQLTYKVLPTDIDNPTSLLHRSNVRTALNLDQKNRRLEELAGEIKEPIREIVKTRHPSTSQDPRMDTSTTIRTPTIDPDELIGRTYLRIRSQTEHAVGRKS